MSMTPAPESTAPDLAGIQATVAKATDAVAAGVEEG